MLTLSLVVGWLCVAYVASVDTVTSGTGGVPCGSGPKCLAPEATCVAGECQCQAPYRDWELSGRLGCWRNNTRWGRGVNDPTYKSLDIDPKTYKYMLPCRVLFTHAKSEMKAKVGGVKQVVGECDCKVFSWNAKKRGKIYTAGIDVTCMLNHFTNASFPSAFTARITGSADNGLYTFSESGSGLYDDSSPGSGTVVNIASNGVNIKTEYDFNNNLAVLDVKACGLSASFTPYDFAKSAKDQPFLPGFTAAWNCAHGLDWQSSNISMATGPEDQNGPVPAIPAGMSRDTFFQFRALTSGIDQSQPNPSPECSEHADVYSQCTDTQKNMVEQRCSFFFFYPKFIKCVDDSTNGDGIMKILRKCTMAICSDSYTCSDFKTYLSAEAAPCMDVRPPQYDSYWNGTWC